MSLLRWVRWDLSLSVLFFVLASVSVAHVHHNRATDTAYFIRPEMRLERRSVMPVQDSLTVPYITEQLEILAEKYPELGLRRPTEELGIDFVLPDPQLPGHSIVSLQQVHPVSKHPIFGAKVKVIFDANHDIVSVRGTTIPTLADDFKTEPTLLPTDAVEFARQSLAAALRQFGSPEGSFAVSQMTAAQEPALIIYRKVR